MHSSAVPKQMWMYVSFLRIIRCRKAQKAPTLEHVGAMSDNSIERTLAQASIYGDNIISLPTRTIAVYRLRLDLSTPALAGSFNVGYQKSIFIRNKGEKYWERKKK